MIKFNSKGLLVPDTITRVTLDEFYACFVHSMNSNTRSVIFENYMRYSESLKVLLGGKPLCQWIDGSYVTRKLNPKDIDLITFVDYKAIEGAGSELIKFGAMGSFLIDGVDAYILEEYPEDHEKYSYFNSDKAYWIDRFDKTRRDRSERKHPKGFLEIIF